MTHAPAGGHASLAGGRVAFTCLIPDRGHVFPLLRQALACESAGLSVALFLSDEVGALARERGLQTETFGTTSTERSVEALRRYTAAGPGGRVLGRYAVERSRQDEADAIDAGLPTLERHLAAFGPGVLVTDSHRYGEVYAGLAARIGARWVVNNAYGSCYTPQGPWLDRALPARTRRALESRATRLATRIQHRLRGRKSDARPHLDAVRADGVGRSWDARVVAGMAPLELALPGIHPDPGSTYYGPFAPLPAGGLDAETVAWLESSAAPAVLVCFGTMVRQPQAVVSALVGEAREQGVRLLWANPERPDGIDATVRWTPWIDQPSALAHARIAGLVTHGGSSSVQESLWYGKPLLVAPTLWDQAHNAWVVDTLGLGGRLTSTRRAHAQVATGLRRIAWPGAHRDRARAAGETLRAQEAGPQFVRLLQALAPLHAGSSGVD